MGKPRHYLKILSHLEQYAKAVSGLSTDWQQLIFDDLTEKGTKVIYERLASSDGRPRIGLCGDVYYCEAGKDSDREDGLFVYRVESAIKRVPSRPPERYEASFYLLTSRGFASRLDQLPAGILPNLQVRVPAMVSPPPVTPAVQSISAPSQELVAVLRGAPAELRSLWLPVRMEEQQTTEQFITAFRKPWVKFQLERFCRLTSRENSVVKQVAKVELRIEERRSLLARLNLDLLNSYVRYRPPELLTELLRSLSVLPLDGTVRGPIWAAMMRALNKDELLREIYNGVDRLRRITGTADEGDWVKAVLQLLENFPQDSLISKLLENSRDQQHPLQYVCDWISENLSFGGPQQAVKAASTPIPEPIAGGIGETEVAAAPAATTVEVVPSSDSRSSVFRGWLLGLQGLQPERVSQLCAEAKNIFSALARNAAAPESIPDIVELRRGLEDLRSRTELWTTELPDPTRLQADYASASEAYDRAFQVLGDEIEVILSTTALGPTDLVAASELVGNVSVLERLPEWCWHSSEGSGISPHKTASERFKALVDPQIRERVISFVSAMKVVGDSGLWLAPIVPAPEGPADIAAIEQHVREYVTNTLELVRPLPESVRSGLSTASTQANIIGKLRQCVAVCNHLKERIPTVLLGDVVNRLVACETEAVAAITAERIERAVDLIELSLGSAADITAAQLDRAMTRNQSSISTPRIPERKTLELRIEHNYVDVPAKRVPLATVPDKEYPFVYVTAPILLYSRHRMSGTISLEYEVMSGHREAWPSEWPSPSPSELTIREDEWREDSDQAGRYQLAFGFRIPCREKGKRTDFLVKILAKSETGELLSASSAPLQWEAIGKPWTKVNTYWPDSIDPKQVEEHPIGPQHHAEQIVSRVEGRGSFCVIAPRRFGKSTLIEFIRQRAGEMGFVAPPSVVCTKHRAGQAFDYEAVWRFVSEELQARLDAAVGRIGPEGLPAENAFDSLRRRAREQGRRGILILFDEAQLFFAERSGHELADILKDRLERHWSVNSEALVPLTLGFAGLPSLRQRMGANFTGYLRPYSQHEFSEDELNTVILGATENALHTTREARRKLASTAGNMYMVRELVNFVATSLNQQQRVWCAYEDVSRIETRLTEDLRDGRQPEVASYIRDILNDELSIWKPNPALPLAVAIAVAKSRRVPDSQLFDAARQVLHEWYASLATESTVLDYDDRQFDEHLAILNERCVLDDKRFRSTLLENWLLGYDRNKDSAEWRNLLFSAAVKRIRIPDSLQKAPDGDGGQANVFRNIGDNRISAYRITRLDNDKSRERFAENRDLLETLKEKVEQGADGAQFIFRLEEIGLSARDENEAVQVYRWVEGADLSQKLGRIPSAFVADIGVKLARAVRFLHSSNILHRDIRPRNVVLSEESADPVIIDFGFARRLTSEFKSSQDSEYSAPEVRRNNPSWTRAADIYSLAATLRAVLDTNDTNDPVLQVLHKCLADNPESRPDAATLVSLFDKAASDLHIADRKAEVDRRVKEAAIADRSKAWYNDTVNKLHGKFAAVALGLLPEQFERCREAANLMNQVLEAFPLQVGGGINKLTLGLVKNENPFCAKRLVTEPVKLMHALRNFEAHGKNKARTDLLSRFPYRTDADLKQASIRAAEQIGSELSLQSLPVVVRLLL